VCGRTILDGEQVRSFVSVDGRHEVCELCEGRTAELGWLPADEEGAAEKLRAGSEPRPGFFARLFARPEREGEEDDGVAAPMPPPPASAVPKPAAPPPRAPSASHELDTERYDVEAAWAEEPPPMPDPAGRGMRPRRLQPDLDPSPTTRFERAVARFNAGEAGRTVSGLTRTLGAPSVSVGDSAGAVDEVRVTVAWELTWYQWGVDLGDELRPVYELDRGFEVTEIDAAARQWNASAHDGRIVMVAPRRREAANGRPVHR
jgi:hypothetical protein